MESFKAASVSYCGRVVVIIYSIDALKVIDVIYFHKMHEMWSVAVWPPYALYSY